MKLMKTLKKSISAILVGVMTVMSLSSAAAFAETTVSREEQISLLMDQRDKINVNILLNSELGLDTEDLNSEFENINRKLEQLGVEELTQQEVLEKVGESDGIMPYLDTPSSANGILWNSYRSTVNISGTNYDVQTIIATQDKDGPYSRLCSEKNIIISSSSGKSAGATEVLKALINNAIDIVVDGNNYAKYIKTAYDYGRAYLSGIQTNTIISNIKASYNTNAVTTVAFNYVKKSGESDNKQVYTFVSTKHEVTVGGMIPTFTYSNGETHPNIVYIPQTNCTSTADHYNNPYWAAKLYVDPLSSASFSYAEKINVYGLDNKVIDQYGDFCPSYISQVI